MWNHSRFVKVTKFRETVFALHCDSEWLSPVADFHVDMKMNQSYTGCIHILVESQRSRLEIQRTEQTCVYCQSLVHTASYSARDLPINLQETSFSVICTFCFYIILKQIIPLSCKKKLVQSTVLVYLIYMLISDSQI